MAAQNTNKDKIRKFLDGLLSGKIPFVSIAAWHATGKLASREPVKQVTRDSDFDPETVANDLLESIRDDAATHGGIQIYKVRALGDDETSALASLAIRVDVSDISEAMPDTGSAIVNKLIQHQEAMFRLVTGSFQNMLGSQSDMLGRAMGRIKELESDQNEKSKLIDEVLTMAHERALEAEREKKAEDRKDEVFKALMKLAPSIVAGLAGKAGSPAAIKAFLDTLDEDQMNKIVSVLRPEQLVNLETLASKVDKESGDSQ